MAFWIAASLVSVALTLMIVERASVPKAGRETNHAFAVYRRQMVELDELAARGLLGEVERSRVRTETGRRLLAAAARDEAPIRRSPTIMVAIFAALAPLIALAASLTLAVPGQADQPFEQRLDAWRTMDPRTLQAPQIAEVLRAISGKHPQDPETLRQFAIAEFDSGQPTEAIQALHKATALAPSRADLWDTLGQILVAQADGDVQADAQDVFKRLQALQPGDIDAGYYLARSRIAAGDVDAGLAEWRALQKSVPAGDPRGPTLAREIELVATNGRLPAQVNLADSDQASQIQAMVDGLAARLRANPDDQAGWVRLVRAYSVLGETTQRDAALADARRRYAGRPDVLRQLGLAAVDPRRTADARRAPPSEDRHFAASETQ